MYLEGLGFRQSQSPEALKASNWTNFGSSSQLNFCPFSQNGLSEGMEFATQKNWNTGVDVKNG